MEDGRGVEREGGVDDKYERTGSKRERRKRINWRMKGSGRSRRKRKGGGGIEGEERGCGGWHA